MLGARLAAVEGKLAPPLLQLAFISEKWGAQAVLGDQCNFITLCKMLKLLNIYAVFSRWKRNGVKGMSPSDKAIMAEVMALNG